MNIRYYILSLLALIFASCNQDTPLEEVSQLPDGEIAVEVTVGRATLAQTRTTISETSSVLKSSWAIDDIIYVYKNSDKSFVGKLYCTKAGDSGTFSGSLSTTATNVDLLFYHFGAGNSVDTSSSTFQLDLAPVTDVAALKAFDLCWGQARLSSISNGNYGVSGTLSMKPILSFVKISTANTGTTVTFNKAVRFTLGSISNGNHTVSKVHSVSSTLTLAASLATAYIPIVPGNNSVVSCLTTDNYICYLPTMHTVSGLLYTSAGGDAAKLIKDTHQAVDLGLPSGMYWATVNIGASTYKDFGDYFAWGDTSPEYSSFSFNSGSNQTVTWKSGITSNGYADRVNCRFYVGSTNDHYHYSKYNEYDQKTVLDPEDDAAVKNWRGIWRMPTLAEYDEMFDNTTQTTVNLQSSNIYEEVLKFSNGSKEMYFSFSAYFNEKCEVLQDYPSSRFLQYWASSITYARSDYPANQRDERAGLFTYRTSDFRRTDNSGCRIYGRPIRPVCP